MQNLMRWAVVFYLSVAFANAAPAVSSETDTLAIKGQSEVPVVKGRLKFKSSRPVCMCAEGMSERDIQQALTRSKQGQVAEPDSDVKRSQDGSKEKNP